MYGLAGEGGGSVVSGPAAWVDEGGSGGRAGTHNSVTPIDELVPNGITVALGTDNIFDIYKPFSDGDMFFELRLLLESTHFYNIDELVKISTVNGRKVLGLLD